MPNMEIMGGTINMTPYRELCRPKISALSAFSALAGGLLASGKVGTETISASAGVFLLACGASALNQYQERATDALMGRTKDRPIPSGRIAPGKAFGFSLWMIVSGLVFLRLSAAHAAPMLFGLLALVWYNGVYTFLKRKTAFAAVPGALVGALPPAVGWTAGGGLSTDPRLAFLCFFFFMWQTPHFWLLLLDRGAEYEAAGFPSLTGVLGRARLIRIVFVWMIAAAASVPLIAMEGITRMHTVNAALLGASAWLAWSAAGLLRKGRQNFIPAFHRINVFALIVLSLMSIDGVVRHIAL